MEVLCESCSKPVNEYGGKCPHCGHRRDPDRTRRLKRLSLAAAVLGLLLLLFALQRWVAAGEEERLQDGLADYSFDRYHALRTTAEWLVVLGMCSFATAGLFYRKHKMAVRVREARKLKPGRMG